MSDEKGRWIEAGKLLARDPKANVLCPRCGKAPLVVTDAIADQDAKTIERHLRCPQCGAYNAMRLRRPPAT